MLNLFKEKVCELYNIIISPIDDIFKTTALENYKKGNKVEHKKNFEEAYYEFIKNNKEKGTVYTPEPIVSYMIENTVSAEQIIMNPYIKIVDPSCGTGNIIIWCFEHLRSLYINNLIIINEKNGLNLDIQGIDEHIITHNLYGFDIDDIAVKILVINLYDLSHGSILHNVFNEDFLLHESEQKFDIFYLH